MAGMSRAASAERARAVATEYRAGATLTQLAAKHAVSKAAISFMLKREGARLTPAETKQRLQDWHAGRVCSQCRAALDPEVAG